MPGPAQPRDVPAHIPPGVQRLSARLGEIPLAFFPASCDLLTGSPLWATGAVAEHQSEHFLRVSAVIAER